MAPLICLILVFVGAVGVFRRRHDCFRWSARIALSAMLVLTATAHFTDTGALVAMVPPQLPRPTALVYASGIIELAAAVGLVLRPSPGLGWLLAGFFLLLLPANVYSAIQEVGLGGRGAAYLWFRVPLQVLFIAWGLWCTGALYWWRRAAPTQNARRPVALDVRGPGLGQ